MMLTKTEFFKKHNGKAMDYDGVAGVQCVDLAKYYFKECFGINPGSWGNARDYWYDTNPTLLKYFDKIKNTKTFVPQRGDVCIFDDSKKQWGHICIGDGVGDTSYFYSYDQNYGQKECTRIKHNYKLFLGVLRPKYKCTSANLNVRSGAGTNYELVDTLDKGTLVQVLETQGSWSRIGDSKWISNKYLD